MFGSIWGFITKTWTVRKQELVGKLIAEVEKAISSLKIVVVEKIKASYSEQDLSKLSVEQVVGLCIELLIAEIKKIILRQI